MIFNKVTLQNIVLKPGPADPGLEPGRVEEKTGEGKTRCDLATRQDPVANPLTFIFFVFLLKRRCFDFFKKKLIQSRPDNPVKTRNPGLGPGWPQGQVLKLCCKIYFL
jgi:hypothetical protein